MILFVRKVSLSLAPVNECCHSLSEEEDGDLIVLLLGQPTDSDGEMRSLLPERVLCEGPPLNHRSQTFHALAD